MRSDLYPELSREIIGAAIDVHTALGPGLLEAVYAECLCHELALRQLPFRREVAFPVHYKAVSIDAGVRLDLVVDERIVVELKSVERLLPVHEAQLITYLKLTGLRLGLMINFNVPALRQGIVRRAL